MSTVKRFRGITPIPLYAGQRGVTFDFFGNPDGNYNFAVAAPSGSGMSFATRELMRGTLDNGVKLNVSASAPATSGEQP